MPGSAPTTEFASANRDTPAFELAYGPRAQATLGAALPVVRRGSRTRYWQAGISALAATENGASLTDLPLELGRAVYGMDLTWVRVLGPDAWSAGVGWGRERARTLGQATLPDPPRPDDIAFGGGGIWLTLRAAWRHRAPHWLGTFAVEERAHAAGLANVPGLRTVGDVLGDFAADALTHAPQLDATLRWWPQQVWQPVLSMHADLQVPADEFARIGYFARLMLGAAHAEQRGETLPFVSLDAGNGKGYLIGRRELRLSVGVRHAFF